MIPNFFDHLFALVVLGLIFPIGGYYAYRRFLVSVAEEGDVALVREYKRTLVWQVALLACPLLLWLYADRPLASLGFGTIRLTSDDPIVTGLTAGAFLGLAARPLLSALSPHHRALMYKGFAKLAPFLPRTGQTLFWGLVVSLAAGTCEEVAYRGFLLPYLGYYFSTGWALALSAAIFGLAHIYQGRLGILTTAGIGAALGYVYLVTQSLALPMLLHVALDVSAMVTAYFVLRPGAQPEPV